MYTFFSVLRSQNNSVSVVICYGLDDKVRFSTGTGIFLFINMYGYVLAPDLRTQLLAALSVGVKQPGRTADHSPPSTVEVKNVSIYTSTPPTPP
jgi:hypothetical protein